MSDEDSKKAPPKKGKRFFEMAKMTASVAGNYTKSRVKSLFQSEEDGEASRAQAQRENGERVAETLGNLKGAAMKIGQMASVATDLLPAELAEPLEELQKDAPPMDYEVVAEQIESELGMPPEIAFAEFDRRPFASASIGQVHRAVADDGREVVCKIQYPGVDESVASDLSQIKLALKLSGFVSKEKRSSFDKMFDEIEARLHEELDYTNEAENVRLFQKMHADDPKVIVPEVVGERSAQRVLTLTEETGDDLKTVRETYTWQQKDTVGENLFRMFGEQMYRHAAIHADPNPANYAFRPDGQIVLYDYGCIKKIPDEQYRSLVEVVRAGLDRDYERIEQAMIDLGARVASKPAPPDEFYEMCYEIFLEPVVVRERYDYGDGIIYERFREHMRTFVEYEAWFQPPPGNVYIDRTVVGIHNILRKIEAEVPCKQIMDEMLANADERLARIDG